MGVTFSSLRLTASRHTLTQTHSTACLSPHLTRTARSVRAMTGVSTSRMLSGEAQVGHHRIRGRQVVDRTSVRCFAQEDRRSREPPVAPLMPHQGACGSSCRRNTSSRSTSTACRRPRHDVCTNTATPELAMAKHLSRRTSGICSKRMSAPSFSLGRSVPARRLARGNVLMRRGDDLCSCVGWVSERLSTNQRRISRWLGCAGRLKLLSQIERSGFNLDEAKSEAPNGRSP